MSIMLNLSVKSQQIQRDLINNNIIISVKVAIDSNTKLYAFMSSNEWNNCTVSVTFWWKELVAAGTMFSQLAPLSGKDA